MECSGWCDFWIEGKCGNSSELLQVKLISKFLMPER